MAPYHLLRIKQVEARTGLHRSQIYAWMKEDHFPQSIKKGIGYDLAGDSGLYFEHTLGYDLGRAEKNSDWRDGANTLKGMGNIKATMNTAFAVGWSVTPWLTVEGKATLPLTDAQGVHYQTSATLLAAPELAGYRCPTVRRAVW